MFVVGFNILYGIGCFQHISTRGQTSNTDFRKTGYIKKGGEDIVAGESQKECSHIKEKFLHSRLPISYLFARPKTLCLI